MIKVNSIYKGNVIEVLEGFPAGSVHMVVTSPPYFALRKYGECDVAWPAGSYIPIAGLAPVEYPEWHGELGLEPTINMFIGHIVSIFREVRRVLRDDGTAWINFGDSYNGSGKAGYNKEYQKNHRNFGGKMAETKFGTPTKLADGLKPKDLLGIPWRVMFALQADGWYLRSECIWNKGNPVPESAKDRPSRDHEHIFLLSKSKKYFFDGFAIKEPTTGGTHSGRKDKLLSSKYQNDMGGFNRRAKSLRNIIMEYRNKRSVWKCNPTGYKGAHFAVFPPRLIEPCILSSTSEMGCCSICGAQMTRVVVKGGVAKSHAGSTFSSPKQRNTPGKKPASTGVRHVSVHDGWEYTCSCKERSNNVRPIVLDPFMGSGTTAEVAIMHGRDFVGIDVKQEYIDLANKRILPLLNNLTCLNTSMV